MSSVRRLPPPRLLFQMLEMPALNLPNFVEHFESVESVKVFFIQKTWNL